MHMGADGTVKGAEDPQWHPVRTFTLIPVVNTFTVTPVTGSTSHGQTTPDRII